MFFKLTKVSAAAAVSWGLCTVASAQTFPTGKIFDLTLGVNSTYQASTDTLSGGTQSAPRGFSTVSEMFDKTRSGELSSINSAYTDTSAAVIRVGYRGLPMVISAPNGSPQIQLTIPALSQVTTFSARPTRDENLDDLEEYLKSEGGAVLNRLQRLLAKASPTDPIAGNPSSLQSQMVGEDYDRAFTQFATNIKESAGETSNLIGVGISYGNFTLGGVRAQSATLPFSYTVRSDLDPRRQLTLYMPITVTTVDRARSFAVKLGGAYRMPVNDAWALTVGAGYGVSGSVDLGSAAAMFAASVTSQYVLPFNGFDVAIGNTVGLYQSQKFSAGGYSFDPAIRNTVYRNGVMVSMPTMALGQKMAVEVSYINTFYTGTDLYSKKYNEVGLTMGTNKSANTSRSYLRGGVSYLQGQNGIKGFRLNVGYWF